MSATHIRHLHRSTAHDGSLSLKKSPNGSLIKANQGKERKIMSIHTETKEGTHRSQNVRKNRIYPRRTNPVDYPHKYTLHPLQQSVNLLHPSILACSPPFHSPRKKEMKERNTNTGLVIPHLVTTPPPTDKGKGRCQGNRRAGMGERAKRGMCRKQR